MLRLRSFLTTALLVGLAWAARGQDQEVPPLDPESEAADLLRLQQSADVYRLARTAVVSVTVTTQGYNLPRLSIPGIQLPPRGAVVEDLVCSGFVVHEAGVVATTYDLIRDAAAVEIRFHDGTTRAAQLIGADQPLGLALLLAELPEGVTALVSAADKSATEATKNPVGWCFAAGERAGDLDVRVAHVRPFDRRGTAYDRYLATIGPVPAGVAGGPLLAADGSLFGMAVVTLSQNPSHVKSAPRGERAPPLQATLYVQGDDILRAARDVLRIGHVERALLGVLLPDSTNVVDQLVPGGGAEAAGVLEGDRILRIGDRAVTDLPSVTRELLRKRPGDVVVLTVERDGELVTLESQLTDASLPPPPSEPPFPGTLLELTGQPGPGGVTVLSLTIVELELDSVLERAGLQAGDRVLQVNGRTAERFLNRYRMRPADEAPRELVIDRYGQRIELDLRNSQ